MHPAVPLVLGLGSLGLMLALRKKDAQSGLVEAKPRQPPPTKSASEPDWKGWITNEVVRAVKSGNVNEILGAAEAIKAQLPQIPTDLQTFARDAITALEKQAQSILQAPIPVIVPPVSKPKPAPVPAPSPVVVPSPVVTPSPVVLPPITVTPDPIQTVEQMRKKTLATQMTNHLKGASRNKEDRNLVKQFQLQEHLTSDGLYGVNTGLAVVQYGVVPAKPYYFSKDAAKTRADKARWTRVMNEQASLDPARSAQWVEAGKVANL